MQAGNGASATLVFGTSLIWWHWPSRSWLRLCVKMFKASPGRYDVRYLSCAAANGIALMELTWTGPDLRVDRYRNPFVLDPVFSPAHPAVAE